MEYFFCIIETTPFDLIITIYIVIKNLALLSTSLNYGSKDVKFLLQPCGKYYHPEKQDVDPLDDLAFSSIEDGNY
jgi:hypothetical protein